MDLNIKVRFSDSNIFDIKCNTDMSIKSLVCKAILARNDITDIHEDQIPQYLLDLFKLVYNGKLYKNFQDKISSILDISDNCILNCIFPILSKEDITKLYNSIKVEVSESEINELLNSEKFKKLIKDQKFFNKLKVLLEKDLDETELDVKEVNELEIYKNQLNELHNIGFVDDKRSIELLKKHNKNMQEVVNDLLG